jgi:hypothetical protein
MKNEILKTFLLVAENFSLVIGNEYKNLMLSCLEPIATKENLELALDFFMKQKRLFKMPSMAEWKEAMGLREITLEEEAKIQWELELKGNEKTKQLLMDLGMDPYGYWPDYKSWHLPTTAEQWVRREFIERYQVRCSLCFASQLRINN